MWELGFRVLQVMAAIASVLRLVCFAAVVQPLMSNAGLPSQMASLSDLNLAKKGRPSDQPYRHEQLIQ